jgi:hypothetical protein
MQPERRASVSPNVPEMPMSGRLSGVTRGVINLVIGTLALGVGERLAAGDTKAAGIVAAVDGGIILADAIATGLIARRERRTALQQQVTIEAQTAEITTLRRGNNSLSS